MFALSSKNFEIAFRKSNQKAYVATVVFQKLYSCKILGLK